MEQQRTLPDLRALYTWARRNAPTLIVGRPSDSEECPIVTALEELTKESGWMVHETTVYIGQGLERDCYPDPGGYEQVVERIDTHSDPITAEVFCTILESVMQERGEEIPPV